MQLLADDLLQAWVLEQQHIVLDLAGFLVPSQQLVLVVFGVLLTRGLLIREAHHVHLQPVHNYFLVQGLRRHYVLHAPHELEAIIVKLLNLADCRGAVLVAFVVFLEEGRHQVRKLTVLVNVVEFVGGLVLDWLRLQIEHQEAL